MINNTFKKITNTKTTILPLNQFKINKKNTYECELPSILFTEPHPSTYEIYLFYHQPPTPPTLHLIAPYKKKKKKKILSS